MAGDENGDGRRGGGGQQRLEQRAPLRRPVAAGADSTDQQAANRHGQAKPYIADRGAEPNRRRHADGRGEDCHPIDPLLARPGEDLGEMSLFVLRRQSMPPLLACYRQTIAVFVPHSLWPGDNGLAPAAAGAPYWTYDDESIFGSAVHARFGAAYRRCTFGPVAAQEKDHPGQRSPAQHQPAGDKGVLRLLPADSVTEHAIDTPKASSPTPRPPARCRSTTARANRAPRSSTPPM